jgi:hypothetical protein
VKRRSVIAGIAAVLVAPKHSAAQHAPANFPRIGLLMGADESDEAPKLDAFRGALEKFGYIATARPSLSRCAMRWGSPTGSPAWHVSWWRLRRP